MQVSKPKPVHRAYLQASKPKLVHQAPLQVSKPKPVHRAHLQVSKPKLERAELVSHRDLNAGLSRGQVYRTLTDATKVLDDIAKRGQAWRDAHQMGKTESQSPQRVSMAKSGKPAYTGRILTRDQYRDLLAKSERASLIRHREGIEYYLGGQKVFVKSERAGLELHSDENVSRAQVPTIEKIKGLNNGELDYSKIIDISDKNLGALHALSQTNAQQVQLLQRIYDATVSGNKIMAKTDNRPSNIITNNVVAGGNSTSNNMTSVKTDSRALYADTAYSIK